MTAMAALKNSNWGWRANRLLNAVIVVLITAAAGSLVSLIAGHFGVSDLWVPFTLGVIVSYVVLGYFTNSDVMMGALGLLMLAGAAYALKTHPWVLANWLSLSASTLSVLFGAMCLFGYLA